MHFLGVSGSRFWILSVHCSQLCWTNVRAGVGGGGGGDVMLSLHVELIQYVQFLLLLWADCWRGLGFFVQHARYEILNNAVTFPLQLLSIHRMHHTGSWTSILSLFRAHYLRIYNIMLTPIISQMFWLKVLSPGWNIELSVHKVRK